MENKKPISPEINEPPVGPGRLLHQARKDLRLAPEDVAQILHLSAKQIVALEQDDYKNLPGPTYIRGYLRGYAQLLGLSPEKVLESYNKLTIPSKPISPLMSVSPPQITSNDHVIKAATIGLVAILLGLVYLWWLSDEVPPEITGSSSAMVNRPTVFEPTKQPSAPEPTPGPAVGGIAPPAAPSSPVTAAGEPVSPAGPSPSWIAKATAPSAPTATAKSVPGESQATVSGMTPAATPADLLKPASPPIPEQTDRAMTRTRRVADIPPGISRSRLVLRASQESWADIRDARDNKLLYENVPAGRSIAIEGVAPFSIFLGNAEGVRVEFNGQNFDFSQYKRGAVARFTVGENAAVNN